MGNKRTPAGSIAMGGVLAALAVVFMTIGTLIPVMTYVCPMLCMVLLQTVLKLCGCRVAWAWYGVVAILAALFSTDKEAAVVFTFLGYYPIVKPHLDRAKGKWIWKVLLFNSSILLAYWILMRILGLDRITAEFEELGAAFCAVLLLMGNVTFFLLDRLLGMELRQKRRGRGAEDG